MQLLSKISNLFTGRKAYSYWPTWSSQSGTSWGYGIERFFLNRRTNLSANNPEDLFTAYQQHELVYACINKIADVMNDAEIIVEKRKGDEWEPVQGHPLTAMFKRPNPYETGRDFRRLMVQSEQVAGIFYAEMVRSAAGMPVEINVLNPNRVVPRTKNDLNRNGGGYGYTSSGRTNGAGKVTDDLSHYEYYRGDGTTYIIRPENMLVRRRVDLINRFYGLSPVAVALKSINSDIGLTDYVDAFFESDGTPSGILKILNATVTDTKKEALQSQWRKKYSRGGSNVKGLAVLDQNAEYQKIGSQLDELDTGNISNRFESRICSVFGVPPILVGSLVGLTHTTANATARAALNDFWDNKISPELAQLREWLTWFVLPQFEGIESIASEQIRVEFDISQAAFLQEDLDGIHQRTRENFKAGLMMLNEAREALGLMPDESAKGADYYVQPSSVTVISPQLRAEEAVKEPEPVPLQLGAGEEDDDETEVPKPTDDEEKPKDEPKAFIPQFPLKEAKAVEIAEEVPPVIEVKKCDFDGLILRREPDHLEKLCDLKSIVSELEINRSRAEKVLKRFRVTLIDQAVTKMGKRTPLNAHLMTLEPDPKTRKELGKAIRNAYATGQNQVARELLAQKRTTKADAAVREVKDLDDDDLEYIENLTDGLISRLINEIQTRAINQYLSLNLLRDFTAEKLKEILLDQSVKFIEQLAESVTNAAIQSGRADEANERKDEWDNVIYSAILDSGTCSPCADADGMEADNPDDLPSAPNSECEGGPSCRCFHIYVAA